MTKIALTIAGVDPSGGAGVYADIRAFAAFGVFPTAAITSITFQNTQGVFGAKHQTADSVRRQVEPILDDYGIDAVKTGMLPNREIIEEVARLVGAGGIRNFVVDPVVRSTSGFDLIDNSALASLIEKLFPLSDLVTPNIPEAERISGVAIETERDIHAAAGIMRSQGARNVLIKGGHLDLSQGDSRRSARDYLFLDGELSVYEGEYHETTATHGTGCTLASAIAANLALGNGLKESVEIAKRYVNEAIRTAPKIGKGNSPINIRAI
jgi:hydroxymethylpyrimidine kinase/phosphomethylpyrimidine kinase